MTSMVQIKSSTQGPVLSARSVYNLIEGQIKHPKNDVQPSIKETLAKKKNKEKKLKKNLKRLDRRGKKSPAIKKINERKTNMKMKADKEINKQKPAKKKIIKNKDVVEDASESSKTKNKENKNKKVNSKSNMVGNFNNLDISEEPSNNSLAAAILAGIELKKKVEYVKVEIKATKKGTKRSQKNQAKTDKKAMKINREKNAEETISMPLIASEQSIKIINQTSDKEERGKIGDGNYCKASSSKAINGKNFNEKNLKLKYKKNLVPQTDKKSLILQADMNNISSMNKEKKTLKRKTETSVNDRKRRRENIISSELVSIKNNLLNKFLRSDWHEVDDSEHLGATLFSSIISPLTPEDFLQDYWEKGHLLIRAADKSRFQDILTTQDIDNILRRHNLSYTKNIDITSYKDGKRETHNPEGRALASVVWDYYNSGCSIRMLNPQTFSNSVWKLLSTLQEFFNSFCGANVYLTPPGTQGFAPHWDDIEAFILQLEGKKRWKVYRWRSEKDTLPRESSGNFGLKDRLGELVLDCVLEPGDLLYFPRGFIHQAEALDDAHSLHITISTYQKNAWVDLLEKLLPAALANAAEKQVEFRLGLPINYMYDSGIAFTDRKTKLKDLMKKKVTELVDKMMEDAPIDAAVDQLAKGFVYDSLPPYVTGSEKQRTIFEGGERWCGEAEGVVNRMEITPETSIRLLRRGCVRLLVEEDSVRLFHSIENSREYHEDEPKFIEISPEVAPGVEMLINSYPEYIKVEELPLHTLEDQMILATGLWEKGIIKSEHELEPSDLEEVESNSSKDS